MSNTQYLKNVAIVGAAGNLGSYITSSLLNTGRHNVTAITRNGSLSTFGNNVAVRHVDYDNRNTIVEALRGHDALVITLSGRSKIEETEAKLVRAAAEAGVKWILPNEWSTDTANEGLVEDLSFILQPKVNTRRLIEQVGGSAYTSFVTGFWYEYSLAQAENFGFDFDSRYAAVFDDGDTPISVSTWPHVGRAVAAFLSLPLRAEEEGEPCFEHYRNKIIYTNSFTLSQRDMLASACRVTGTEEEDWTIKKEDVHERFERGQQHMRDGDVRGSRILYTRGVFAGDGDFEYSCGTINGVLGLPSEDVDGATKVAVEMQLRHGGRH